MNPIEELASVFLISKHESALTYLYNSQLVSIATLPSEAILTLSQLTSAFVQILPKISAFLHILPKTSTGLLDMVLRNNPAHIKSRLEAALTSPTLAATSCYVPYTHLLLHRVCTFVLNHYQQNSNMNWTASGNPACLAQLKTSPVTPTEPKPNLSLTHTRPLLASPIYLSFPLAACTSHPSLFILNSRLNS